MKTLHKPFSALLIYDSAYGNTRLITSALYKSLDSIMRVRMIHVKDTWLEDMRQYQLVIIGSPTQGGQPTRPIQDFLEQLSDEAFEGVYVAAFDTRFAMNEHGFGLHMLMRTIGFAASKIVHAMKRKGGELLTAPAGFIVTDKAGPLRQGELKRAGEWAEVLAAELADRLARLPHA